MTFKVLHHGPTALQLPLHLDPCAYSLLAFMLASVRSTQATSYIVSQWGLCVLRVVHALPVPPHTCCR